MSILSSANSGKLRVVNNELSKYFRSGVNFETYTDKNDGDVYVKLKPEQWNGPIYINGNIFPCKISKFEAAPVLHLLHFNEHKHFSILPFDFQGMSINYEFSNCQFSQSTFDYLIRYYHHIVKSEIYLPPVYLKSGGVPYIEYFEDKEIETISFLYDLCKQENKIYILRTCIEPDIFSPKWESFNRNLTLGRESGWYELSKDEIHSLFMYNERYKKHLEEMYLGGKQVHDEIIYPGFNSENTNSNKLKFGIW